ncbi:MAG: VTT domain-containing protein [Amphiplicatus sp.]
MDGFERQGGRFFSRMDARAWTSLGVSLFLLAVISVLFVYGRGWLHLDEEGRLGELVLKAASPPFTLAGVVSVYLLATLTGYPQLHLLGMTMLAIPGEWGALHAFLATMASAVFTFWLGHALCGRFIRRLDANWARAAFGFLDRHAVFLSFVFQVVPLGPYLVINAIIGALRVPFWKFVIGAGLGVVLKIGLVLAIAALSPDASLFEARIVALVDFFQIREWADFAILAALGAASAGVLVSLRALLIRLFREGRKE